MNHRVEWHANFAANISTMAAEAIPVMTVHEHNRLQSGDLCNLCIFPYVWKTHPGNDRNSSPRSPKTVKVPFGEVTMRRSLSYALRHTDGIISAYVAAPIWYGYRISNCISTETSRTPPVYCPVCFCWRLPLNRQLLCSLFLTWRQTAFFVQEPAFVLLYRRLYDTTYLSPPIQGPRSITPHNHKPCLSPRHHLPL